MGVDSSPLLDLRGFTLERRTSNGLVTILQDIDLQLESGQWVAVVGANGSGKSSLLKFLAAENTPLRGRVAYMAQDPDDQLIAETVAGEITLGQKKVDPLPVLAAHGLQDLAELDPRLLSAGQKQRLNMAVATGLKPEVLLCDEPTSLQDHTQAAWVLDQLDQWRQQTQGCLVTATCDRREAARADWLVVLHQGQVLAQGPAAELVDTPAVRELLLGFADDQSVPFVPPQVDGDPVLTLQQSACAFMGPGQGFGPVDLSVRAGQRIGIMGANGCGKSTFLAMCAGLRPPDEGRVALQGHTLYKKGAQDLDHGLAMLAPQFPEYMFCRTTVAAELGQGLMPSGVEAKTFLRELGLDPQILTRNPHDLSSGQKRRLAVGMVARCQRPLLLMDEPTAALDRQGRRQVLDILNEVGRQSAMIVASHDQTSLEALGCRIYQLTARGLSEKGLAALD